MLMSINRNPKTVVLRVMVVVLFIGGLLARASNLDVIGVTLLRSVTTNLNGGGIRVAQVEGEESSNAWEVNPGHAIVAQPITLFAYASAAGTSTNFPNAVGLESGHADVVASYFYGVPGGVVTNIAHVDNYDASYCYNSIIAAVNPPNINARVVNQSFIEGTVTTSQQQAMDSNYDDYAARYNTLFVSGAGNGIPPQVTPPATCYNGIAVGAYLNFINYSSVGPTPDNGRAKPDITAPSQYTSYSTPQVAGAATLLMQAGLRGDGGSQTNAAADIRTVKALLLNGAIKPATWTNSNASPLDARYGAGVLNVFNAYQQLAFGKQPYTVSNTVSLGNPHPPTGTPGSVSTLSGWDFNTNTSTITLDGVNHYYFNLTNGTASATFVATATLIWNRQQNQTGINDLDLFLYNATTSNLVVSSTSAVDNVEHIFVTHLPAGRYDLQVLKHGGTTASGKRISNAETYALAFEFFSPIQTITRSNLDVLITWPLYPDGFVLESTTNLNLSNNWTINNSVPTITNNQNRVIVNTSSNGFFRLRWP